MFPMIKPDSRQNNKKVTVLQFKMGNFVKFYQISSKINIFTTRVVFVISSVFPSKMKSFGT